MLHHVIKLLGAVAAVRTELLLVAVAEEAGRHFHIKQDHHAAQGLALVADDVKADDAWMLLCMQRRTVGAIAMVSACEAAQG